jgi:hypothetical protein
MAHDIGVAHGWSTLGGFSSSPAFFLRPAYTQADIAELPDSDDDNGIVDEYDEMAQHDTVKPEHGPFQNYVVSIFFHTSNIYDF